MLVQFVEPKLLSESDNWDYDAYHVISAFDVKDYQRFIKFIETMKGRECVLNDKWYTVDSYMFNLPRDSDYVPCIRVYIAEYC